MFRFHNEEEISSSKSEQLLTLKEIFKKENTEKKELYTGTIKGMNFITSFSTLERTATRISASIYYF